MNAKGVFRICREEGTGLPRKFAEKRAHGVRGPYVNPERMDPSWAMDFVADRLVVGSPFRIPTLTGAHMREALFVRPD